MKLLIIDYDLCSGCRVCELICSMEHAGVFKPSISRIRVVKNDKLSIDVPLVCIQCESPACVNICPAKALSKDEETGIVRLNPDKCIGCNLCILKCPYHGVFKTPDGVVVKCDLCGGDPRCVKYCPTGALQYVEESPETKAKREKSREKLLKLLREYELEKPALRIARVGGSGA